MERNCCLSKRGMLKGYWAIKNGDANGRVTEGDRLKFSKSRDNLLQPNHAACPLTSYIVKGQVIPFHAFVHVRSVYAFVKRACGYSLGNMWY